MNTRPLVILLAIATLAPVAAAGWGARGAYEPDTNFDKTQGWMRQGPDTAKDGISRVYFSGFEAVITPAAGTGVNPNLATLGTYHIITPFTPYAMLGVWKDCNKDGFVGAGDQGLIEYPAQLLSVPNANGVAPLATVCSVETIPTPIPDGWKPVHNDGQWVHELLPIGWEVANTVSPDNNPWNIQDNGARIWADWGLPGGKPGYLCYITSHPRGSFDNTGNMLDLVDCTARHRIAGAMAATPQAAPVWAAARSIENPWGHDSDDSFVTGADCSGQPQRAVPGTEVVVTVPTVGAPSPNSGGSIGGTLNETETQFGDCNYDDRDSVSVKRTPYSTETDIHNQEGERIINDFVLTYIEGCRRNALPQVPNCNPTPLGRGAPGDAGVRGWDPQGFWSANALVVFNKNPFVSIDDVVQKVQHLTFYGVVSGGAKSKYALDLPRGATEGTYGSEGCPGGIGAGQGLDPVTQWNCDPANWWVPTGDPSADAIAFAQIEEARTFVAAKVGAKYNLLDVDCYDESTRDLRNEDLGWGVVTSTQCA